MDILSHGLWGATILRRRKLLWWAIFAGMAPDVFGSGSAFLYLLTIGKFWGTDTWQYLPQWTRELYHFHHSLLSVAVYGVVLSVLTREHYLLLLPYLFHVVLDGFTHETNIMDTWFYPLVFDFGLIGLNWWEHGWIIVLNAAALVGTNLYFFLRKRRRPTSAG